MVVYYSMFGVLFLCWMISKDRATAKKGAFIIFAYIIFWVGIRDAFVDTAAYIARYEATSIETLRSLNFTIGSGWGFTIIEALFKGFISQNYHVWLMFIAIVCGACVGITFWRYSDNFFYTVFLFLATTTFTWMMNGIRQYLAVCILFACTPLIEHKKFVRYMIAVLLCSTIHVTALIMLPTYFLVQGKPWNKKTNLVLIFSILVTVFTSRFVNALDTMLENTTYASAVDQFALDDGVNPLRVLVFSIPAIYAWVKKNEINRENDLKVNICINYSVYTMSIYLVAMVTSGILIGRLPIYTLMYEFILIPSLYERSSDKSGLYAITTIMFLIYFFIMSRGMYYSNSFIGRIY